jgi:hypothetical protein
MLADFLRRVSCEEMTDAQIEDAVQFITGAPDNPELEWTEDPARAREIALFDALSDYIAESDKIDELHEQIQAFFTEDFPPFPHDPRGKQPNGVATYYRWLDTELQTWNEARGGYALLLIDNFFDDNARGIIVFRPDVPRILELADSLGFRFSQSVAE